MSKLVMSFDMSVVDGNCLRYFHQRREIAKNSFHWLHRPMKVRRVQRERFARFRFPVAFKMRGANILTQREDFHMRFFSFPCGTKFAQFFVFFKIKDGNKNGIKIWRFSYFIRGTESSWLWSSKNSFLWRSICLTLLIQFSSPHHSYTTNTELALRFENSFVLF